MRGIIRLTRRSTSYCRPSYRGYPATQAAFEASLERYRAIPISNLIGSFVRKTCSDLLACKTKSNLTCSMSSTEKAEAETDGPRKCTLRLLPHPARKLEKFPTPRSPAVKTYLCEPKGRPRAHAAWPGPEDNIASSSRVILHTSNAKRAGSCPEHP